MIILSLLETKEHDAISLSEKENLIQKNSWITEDFRQLNPDLLEEHCHRRHQFLTTLDRVKIFPTLEELMTTSHCLEDNSIESTPNPDSDVLQSFGYILGFSLVLFQTYFRIISCCNRCFFYVRI